MTKTIVVFRKDESGVFALFPEIPSDNHGRFCTCYQHVGQHSGAYYHPHIRLSKPATPEEYADLFDELTKIGYTLKIRKRASYKMHQTRWNAIPPISTRIKRSKNG